MSLVDSKKMGSDFRVGLITFVGLLFLIVGITFAGGDKGLLFQKTSLVKARLVDVGGLKKGGSVTMGGMTIGRVSDIAFVNDAEGRPIEVVMEVRSDMVQRIKSDSVPAVRTQGMLGDRYVDVPAGREDATPLESGSYLQGASASDFDTTLKEATEVLTQTEKVLNAMNQKEGTVGRLLYDKGFYDKLMEMTTELNELIKDFKKRPRRYIKFSLF